ncbi:MAG TPA: isocitrate lyase/phosphoenolpyruvate mutase family protein [Mycobacteriales bacterium]|nr:isocitrate lyase/phosphoenolpyruvate mutase family protein [Mycobacteriales bacterium]
MDEVLAAAEQIVRAVSVPVTVDFERGYRLAPAELVERFVTTGAAGLNLEDSDPSSGAMVDAGEQADFLAAVREAARSLGVDLVLNARTDSFLRAVGTQDEQLAATLDRGSAYLAAGADCVYPIGVTDPGLVKALAVGIPGPVNVVYGTGALSVAELGSLGAGRVSFGPSLQRLLYGKYGARLLATLASDENPFTLGGQRN